MTENQVEGIKIVENIKKDVIKKLTALLPTDDKGGMCFVAMRAKAISRDNVFVETEALQFVYNSKPRDFIEAYHFLNMFQLTEITKHNTEHLGNDNIKEEVKNEQSKITMRATYEYSGAWFH